MSHFRSIVAAGVATSVIVLPIIASAQTTSLASLQQQLQSLLAEITLLQLAASSTPAATTPTPTASAPATSNIICPTIARTLALGDSGTDVANLQGFLAQNPLIYPEESVTGYFGMFTQDAVQRWQSAYGVVSSGNPATTGYGVVGSRTRAAILASCANNTGTSSGQSSVVTGQSSTAQPLCPVSPQPANTCLGTWSPLTNATGCTIAWQCTISFSGASSSAMTSKGPFLTAAAGPNSPYVEMFSGNQFPTGMYTFYYGDGISTTVTAVCPTTSVSSTSSMCGTFSASHVYASGGTYLATIVDSTGATVADATVDILAPVAATYYTYTSNPTTYTYTSSAISLTASPGTFTTLPDTVTFTATNLSSPASNYSINFGDGSQKGFAWSATSTAGTFTQSHAYASTGTFTVSLVDQTGASIVTFAISITAAH